MKWSIIFHQVDGRGDIKSTADHQITGSLTLTGSSVDFTEATGVSGSFSGSFQGDGSGLTGIDSSSISNVVYTNLGDAENQIVQGSLTLTGNLTAEEYIISSSVIHYTESFSSGSTRFGDESSDTHQFTGSVNITGSQILTGSLSVGLDGDTDRFRISNTDAWAGVVFEIDHTSEEVIIGNTASAAYFSSSIAGAINPLTASNAVTASYIVNAQTASYIINAQTASFVQNAISSSYTLTASFIEGTQGISGSFSGSFQGDGANLTGVISASYANSSSYANTASFVTLAQTASYVTTAQTASFVENAQTASYITTASYVQIQQKPVTSSFTDFTASGDWMGHYILVGAMTCSVQANSDVAVPIGAEFHFFNSGSGGNDFWFQTGSGVTIWQTGLTSYNDGYISPRFYNSSLKKVLEDTWVLRIGHTE